MGIFSSIKKLFFATESVAKSGTEKAVDYTKDKIDDIGDVGKKYAEDLSDVVQEKTSGLRDSLAESGDNFIERSKDAALDIKEKASDIIENITEIDAIQNIKDKAEQAMADISDTEIIKKAAETSETVGDQILDTGEDFMEGIENLGNSVLEKGETFAQKAKDLSEKVGNDILDKGKNVAEKINSKIDETVVKAEKEAMEEAQNPKGKFNEETLDASGSLLEGEDDFFSKASKFADGDYGVFSEGKIEIMDHVAPKNRKEPAKAAGYTDRDGDGDELIDDAIISEEE